MGESVMRGRLCHQARDPEDGCPAQATAVGTPQRHCRWEHGLISHSGCCILHDQVSAFYVILVKREDECGSSNDISSTFSLCAPHHYKRSL